MTLTLDPNRIEASVESALASGFSWWRTSLRGEDSCTGHPVWHIKHTDEIDDGVVRVTSVTLGRFAVALTLCARHHPSTFGRWWSGQGDAVTDDVVLQLAVFGKLVFA